MSDDELQKRREEARLAMESEAHRLKRAQAEEELAKKKKEAIEAMEGYERKIKRELDEKIERERILTEKRLAEERERKAKEEEEKRQRELAEIRAKKEEEERVRMAKLTEIKRSEEVIEDIASRSGSDLSAIRTIKSDLTDAVRGNKISLAKIMLKQKDREQLSETPGERSNLRAPKWIKAALLFCLCSIIVIIIYIWSIPQISEEVVNTKQQTPISSLVFAEKNVGVNIAGQEPNNILEEVVAAKNTETRQIGDITNIYFTNRDAVTDPLANNPSKVLGLKDFLKSAAIDLPPGFLNFIQDRFMLGAYSNGTRPSVFYVLRTREPENAGVNLLSNENNIVSNLLMPIMQKPIGRELIEGSFQNKIVDNREVRSLLGPDGKSLVLYGFIDNNTILITENEETFKKVSQAYQVSKTQVR